VNHSIQSGAVSAARQHTNSHCFLVSLLFELQRLELRFFEIAVCTEGPAVIAPALPILETWDLSLHDTSRPQPRTNAPPIFTSPASFPG
jgi:hypothetical protein